MTDYKTAKVYAEKSIRFANKKNVDSLLVLYICQKHEEESLMAEEIEKQSKGLTDKKKISLIKEECERKMLETSNLDQIYNDIKEVDQKIDKTHLEVDSIYRNWRLLPYIKSEKKRVEERKFIEEKCMSIYYYEEKVLSPYLHAVWWVILEILLISSEYDDTDVDAQLAKRISQDLVHLYPSRPLGWIRTISYQFKEQCIEKIVDLVAPSDEEEEKEEKDEKDENESGDVFLQAIKILNDNLLFYTDCFEGWSALCAMHLSRINPETPSSSKAFKHHVSYAQGCAEKALSLMEEKEVKHSCKINTLRREILLVEAGTKIKLKNLHGCIETFEHILQIEKNDVNALKALSLLHIKTNTDIYKAADYLQTLINVSKNDKQLEWAYSQLGMVKCYKSDFDSAENYLLSAIKLDPKNYFSFHWLGRVYWEKGGKFREQKEYSKMNFLTSAKLNPNFSTNYTYLGFIFVQVEKDEDRGIKCLEKAITMNNLEEKAAHMLSDLYLQNGKVVLAYKLHKKIVNANTNIHWASLRLALYQFEKEKYAESITNYQRALRVVPNDVDTWIGLGKAYVKLGRYMAALKAFEEVTKLNEKHYYAIYQIAEINLELGVFQNAIKQFTNALEILKREMDDESAAYLYVPSYYGLLCANYELGKQYFFDGMHGSSFQIISNILPLYQKLLIDLKENPQLSKCASIEPQNLLSLQKLFGDLHTFYFFLPTNLFSGENQVENKVERISSAISFYQQMIKLLETKNNITELSFSHFDCGVNYFYQAQVLSKHKEQENRDRIGKLFEKSAESFKKAIHYDNNNSAFWNALGIVEKLPKIQQHCFLKSIQLDSKSGKSWIDLGVLYLKNGLFEQANKAFITAQTVESNVSEAWLGLALSMESVSTVEGQRIANGAYTSLFSSKTSASSEEGWLGLAYSSFAIGDYNNSSIALEKYRELDFKDESDHLNILGLSLILRGMYTVAEKILEKSLSLLENDLKTKKETKSGSYVPNPNVTLLLKEEQNKITTEEKLQIVYVNCAYVHSKTGNYDKSLQCYLKIDKRETDVETLLSISHLYYLKKDLGNCVTYSMKAFEVSNEEKQKVNILINLSKCCYKLGEIQSSKKHAILAIQKFPENKEGWYCAATLSLLTKDFKITTKSLDKIYNLENSTPSLLFNLFSSYLSMLSNEGNTTSNKQAGSFLQKSLHLNPENTDLWLHFCEYQITDPSKHSENVYLLISNMFPLFNKLFSQSTIPSLSFQILSLSYLMIGSNQFLGSAQNTLDRCRNLIHKLLMHRPDDNYVWLLFSFYSYNLAQLKNKSETWIASQKILNLILQNNFFLENNEILLFVYGALIDTHLHLFQYDQSNELLEKLEKKIDTKNEEMQSKYLWQKSKVLSAKKEHKQAILTLQKSTSLHPKNYIAWIDLGNLFFQNRSASRIKDNLSKFISGEFFW
eukprot:TRINITY_DN2509_c0_g1_i1.p1 TRINITY_DN2509_c0_g1~~TRINITY_DN2509_c0_g1_i1.p1  ORF type:complete len:1553 (-),score=502.76 TRINITY_DN2509_c0_g1_i1:412-4707(-)